MGTLDMFLQHRTPESVLKKKAILPSNNMQSNDDINKAFWNNQKQKKLQIQSTLSRKLANHRRQNSRTLAQRFSNRMKPNEVLNKGIIRMDDYNELFHALPQTQPTTPTSDHEYKYDANMNDDMNDKKQKREHTKKRIIYTKETKLAFKIKQRPTINEMKSRGLMYDDPLIPASLQNRKRELHRRRASKTLEAFLLKRPNKETLKRRHIM